MTTDLFIQKCIRSIDEVSREVRFLFGSLSEEELNKKPGPTAWSIAQNLDHLIKVNESYFPVLAALHAGTYKVSWLSQSRFLVSFFGKTVLGAVQPDRRKKMQTFPIWEPAKGNRIDNILLSFEQHQSKLKQEISASAALLDRGVVISSPANRMIVYRLETAFDIILTHELRHLEQARAVLTALQLGT